MGVGVNLPVLVSRSTKALRLFSRGVTGSRWDGSMHARMWQRWSRWNPSGMGPTQCS